MSDERPAAAIEIRPRCSETERMFFRSVLEPTIGTTRKGQSNMITKTAFETIKRKHGRNASWAVWGPIGATPKAGMSDLSVFENDGRLRDQQLRAVWNHGLNRVSWEYFATLTIDPRRRRDETWDNSERGASRLVLRLRSSWMGDPFDPRRAGRGGAPRPERIGQRSPNSQDSGCCSSSTLR